MASSLSYFGFHFEDGEDTTVLAKLASDESLDQETRIMALMVAVRFRAITFAKAEELMTELGLVSNTYQTFEKYIKRFEELNEQSK